MNKFLTNISWNNEEYDDAVCDTRDKNFNEDKIQKVIKDGIIVVIQNKVEEKECDYCTLTNEDWIDLIGTLDTHNYRRRTDFENNNSFTKKKKDYWYAGTNYNIKAILRASFNKKNNKPGKVRQNTNSYRGV